MFIDLLFTFFITFAILFLMSKAARKVGLVNKPSGRKLHSGNIPLEGGITIVNYIYSHPVFVKLLVVINLFYTFNFIPISGRI